MTDLRITGQVAEVLHQADDPPLRAKQIVTETSFQTTQPPLRISQQTIEALVSLGGTGPGRRRTVVVVAS